MSPETAAQTILAGAAARKGTDDAKGIPMPKDADLRLEFSDMVKDAFAGDAQGHQWHTRSQRIITLV